MSIPGRIRPQYHSKQQSRAASRAALSAVPVGAVVGELAIERRAVILAPLLSVLLCADCGDLKSFGESIRERESGILKVTGYRDHPTNYSRQRCTGT